MGGISQAQSQGATYEDCLDDEHARRVRARAQLPSDCFWLAPCRLAGDCSRPRHYWFASHVVPVNNPRNFHFTSQILMTISNCIQLTNYRWNTYAMWIKTVLLSSWFLFSFRLLHLLTSHILYIGCCEEQSQTNGWQPHALMGTHSAATVCLTTACFSHHVYLDTACTFRPLSLFRTTWGI